MNVRYEKLTPKQKAVYILTAYLHLLAHLIVAASMIIFILIPTIKLMIIQIFADQYALQYILVLTVLLFAIIWGLYILVWLLRKAWVYTRVIIGTLRYTLYNITLPDGNTFIASQQQINKYEQFRSIIEEFGSNEKGTAEEKSQDKKADL